MRLHSIEVRVYYEDTDAGGIVYYANYLRFFERARTDWLRAAGIRHEELSRLDGLGLVVRECAVQYLRPALLDDLLAIEVGVSDPATDIGRASLRLSQRALLLERSAGGTAAQTVLATATVRIACLAARTGRPAPLPQRVVQTLAAQLSVKAQPQDPLPAAPPYSQQITTTVKADGKTAQE